MKNPWAFKIDYDAAIKEDEKCIAFYMRALANDWTTDAVKAFYAATFPEKAAAYKASRGSEMGSTATFFYSVVDIPAFAAACGLTTEDIAVLVATNDCFEDAYYDRFGKPSLSGPALWKRSDEICKLLDTLYFEHLDSRENLTKALKNAKASLARHKRNKAVYGK